MNCKNCNHSLTDSDKFCNACGAKIILKRITLKNLVFDELVKAFGWDNKFWSTFKNLILQPEVVFKDYINGTRKKHVPPITFFIVGMTVSLIVFNIFHDEYISLSTINSTDYQEINSQTLPSIDLSDEKAMQQLQIAQFQEKFTYTIQNGMLKYFNLYSFLMLPLYSLIASWVYRKKYRYSEHLVIASYIQGFLFLFTTLFFLISIAGGSGFQFLISLFAMVYYSYAYGRLLSLSFGSIILYFLKFLLIGFLILLVFGIIGIVSTIIYLSITQ